MKSSLLICSLIIFCGCIVSSFALSISSILRSYSNQKTSSETTSSSLHELPTHEFHEIKQADEDTQSYSSETYSEYRNDPDLYVYNSSSDQELKDLLDFNSSSDGNDTSQSDSTHDNVSNSASNATEKSSSSESSSAVHTSSESPKSDEVIWNKLSTPAQLSTTLGQIAAANFTTDEKEEVVLVTGETTPEFGPKTVFQKSLDWMADEYTLSIALPISAGIIFAITIICTIAMCRCMRRCCRRRRFKKKCLPDSVKSLSASDRARLLGDTSDEEF